MAKTLKQIAEETAYSLGAEYGNLDTQSLFDEWMIDVLHELLSEADWPFAKQEASVNSAASTENVTLAAGTGEITSIRSPDRDLIQIEKDELIDRGFDMTETGTPDYFYHNGMSSGQKLIGLYPIPSAIVAYTVRSVLEPSQLTRTSTLPTPEDTIPYLKHKLREAFRLHEKDYDGAALAERSAMKALRLLKRKHITGQSRTSRFKASDVPPTRVINHIRTDLPVV